MSNLDELLERIGRDNRPIEMVTSPARLFILISYLQLALRHSNQSDSGRELAGSMAENMAKMLCHIHPDARVLIDQGWDSTCDMNPDQFEAVKTGAVTLDEVRLSNASTLLIEAARQLDKPLVLAANAELDHEDGVQPGDPSRVDIEDIRGFTFSMHCNQHEAQFLINVINKALEALSDIRNAY